MTDKELLQLQLHGEVSEEDINNPPQYMVRYSQRGGTCSYGPVNLFVARMLKRELTGRALVAWIEVE